MTRFCWTGLLTVCVGFWSPPASANEGHSSEVIRSCPIDDNEVKNGLYVDIAGIRLQACSQECLKKITENRGYIRLVQESGREPERIPVNRSFTWTEEDLLDGMVHVAGGEFARAGSFLVRRPRSPERVEHEAYRVRISSFYMDKYEVTYGDYCEFLNDGNDKYATGGIQRDEHGKFVPPRAGWSRLPVRGANYYQACGYAEWAGKRLPTEAEWEFAHGGAEGRTYPWGDEPPTETRVNFGPTLKGLKPVGSLPEGRTPEGIFDLAGNIGEWCADYYDEDYYRLPPPGGVFNDPQGPTSGNLRVFRLGCQCRGATVTDLHGNLRCYASPFRVASCVGFRCVKNQ